MSILWYEHIDSLKQDCTRRLDLMKSLDSTTWGASRKMLQMFYVSYIRSKLKYRCELFSDASDEKLNKIVKIQSAALRLVTGAQNATPITSLEVETHIQPLRLRLTLYVQTGMLSFCINQIKTKQCHI